MSKNQLLQLFVRLGHKVFVVWWWLTRPTTRGVKIIVLKENKVLLVRLSYGHQSWSFPGGGVRHNETTKDAAMREIAEETGILIQTEDLKLVTQYDQQIEYKSDTVTCYLVRVETDDFKIDNREVCEAGWFGVDELPSERTQNIDSILELIQV